MKKALKPYKRKLELEAFLKAIFISLIVGAIAGMIIIALSFVLPIKIFRYHFYIGFALTSLMSLIFTYSIYKPKLREVSLRVDKLGLHEKTQTMLEYEKEDSPYTRLQRKDAINSLERISPRALRIRLSKKLMGLALIMLASFFLLAFVPNRHREEIIKQEEAIIKENEEIDKLLEKLEEKIEEADFDQEELLEAKEILKELEEKLKNAKSPSEKLAAINDAMEKLEDLIKKKNDNELKELADSLKKEEATKDLGEGIENKDIDKIAKGLEKIKDSILEGDIDKILDALKEARELASKEMQEALDKLVQNLEGLEDLEDLDKILSDALEDIGDALDGETPMDGDLGQILEDMKDVAGEGQGKEPSDSNGNGNGTGEGEGKVEEKKDDIEIFDPNQTGKQDDDIYVPGQKDDNGQIQKIEIGDADIKEGSVPYDDVYKEYIEGQRQAMDREVLPSDIRALIEKYYASIG